MLNKQFSGKTTVETKYGVQSIGLSCQTFWKKIVLELNYYIMSEPKFTIRYIMIESEY